MARKPLTSVGIKNLRAASERQEIKDGGSSHLYLIVQPSGHKSFALRFRKPDGKAAKLVLGPFDPSPEGEGDPTIGQPLTLAAARHLAADLGRERARGRDIVADRKTERTRRQIENANTFAAAARDFIDNHAKPKTRGWRRTSRLLGLEPDGELVRAGLAERWAGRSIADLDGHDIYAVVEEARARGVPGHGARTDGPSESRARHLFSALSTMFWWLHRHRRIAVNPTMSVHRPDPAGARDRVLTGVEIAKFWKAASAEQKHGALLKLLLLTGCRLNEVAGMRRSELSDGTWTIPGERTKNHRVHVAPLPPLARQLISDSDTDLIFTTTGVTPVQSWSKLKRRLDKAIGDGVPPWRLHDLRRTAATGMAEIGIAPHIVEACLNHISGARAGVAGVYNRALYADEKRAALARWAAHVEGLVAGKQAKVVALRKKS